MIRDIFQFSSSMTWLYWVSHLATLGYHFIIWKEKGFPSFQDSFLYFFYI